jgi:hypothetical protein
MTHSAADQTVVRVAWVGGAAISHIQSQLGTSRLSSLSGPLTQHLSGQQSVNDDDVMVVTIWLQVVDQDFFVLGIKHWFPARYVSQQGWWLHKKRIRKVYSLEYIDIPEAFFAPHCIDRSCTDVIWGHCCILGHSSLTSSQVMHIEYPVTTVTSLSFMFDWLWWGETDISELRPLRAYCSSPGNCDVDHGMMVQTRVNS